MILFKACASRLRLKKKTAFLRPGSHVTYLVTSPGQHTAKEDFMFEMVMLLAFFCAALRPLFPERFLADMFIPAKRTKERPGKPGLRKTNKITGEAF